MAAVSSYTAHTADAPAGIPCWLSAISFRTHALQLTALLPGAVLCAFHNISVRKGQEPHSRDVCTVCLVCMAFDSSPIFKDRPVLSFSSIFLLIWTIPVLSKEVTKLLLFLSLPYIIAMS